MAAKGNKQYGLIKMNKSDANKSQHSGLLSKPSIFDQSSSDSEDDAIATLPHFQSSSAHRKAQEKILQDASMDPSIFQYDEVYDEMKSATEKKQVYVKTEKSSRYIANMLKQSDQRKKEDELREERKIQKERELEGDQFKDKEAFITPAYREKLEQISKTEEEIRRQQNLDNVLDVTKQSDLSIFYRSLYRNSLFADEESAVTATEETKQTPIKFNKKSSTQKANIRERNLADEDDNEVLAEQEVNLSDTNKAVSLSNVTQEDEALSGQPVVEPAPSKETSKKTDNNETATADVCSSANAENPTESESLELPIKKPKVDRHELIRKIFTKRTIGQVYEQARERYLQRKALRGC